jgi:hypothetical protein
VHWSSWPAAYRRWAGCEVPEQPCTVILAVRQGTYKFDRDIHTLKQNALSQAMVWIRTRQTRLYYRMYEWVTRTRRLEIHVISATRQNAYENLREQSPILLQCFV